jgi:uncharacterized protein YcbK (DUF882 family)
VSSVSLLAASAGPAPAAPGESRTLTFVHTHREDSITVTFRRDGAYDQAALNQLNWFLRDWRTNETTTMDPRLFDILWEMQRELGSTAAIHVISAYRSPTTNGALRRKSGAVAENSLHMAGKAIDVRMPGIDSARVRSTAMQVQYGGVGFYPGADFVHVDTGSVRAWPRMSKEQLIALFPTGKTLHLPSNGPPLPGYEQARTEIQARQAALSSAPFGSPGRRPTAPITSPVKGHDGAGRGRLAGEVQLASTAPAIGITGSLIAKVRDERALLRALFVSPAEPVSAVSTPLMHMTALDQPLPRAETIAEPPMVMVRFDPRDYTAESTSRFRGPAVQPLPTFQAR